MEDFKLSIGSGETYNINQNHRALMYYEIMQDEADYKESYKISNHLKMFYCILKGANRLTFRYSFDEFLDILDEKPELVQVFTDYLNSLATGKKKAVNE